MKQMLTSAGGVFFAISIIFLVIGASSYAEMEKLRNKLENRSGFRENFDSFTGIDEWNKGKLELLQDRTRVFFVLAGATGCLGIGLALPLIISQRSSQTGQQRKDNLGGKNQLPKKINNQHDQQKQNESNHKNQELKKDDSKWKF